MRCRRHTLVLFGLAFALTPFSLDASPWMPQRVRPVPKVRTTHANVSGLKVAAKLDAGATKGLTVALDVHNPGPRTITAALKVDVYSRKPSSPMARMIPSPVHHGSRILKVKVKAGAKLALSQRIKKGGVPKSADAPRYYAVVRPATQAVKTVALRR